MRWAVPGFCVASFAAATGSAQPSRVPGSSERPAIPAIYLLYNAPNGTVFDRNCGGWFKTIVSAGSVQEAVRRAPEFQALWDHEGPAYLSTTFAEIGLPFPYKEMQATLTVCPGVISMSTPLIINVTSFLPSATTRDPDWLFVETVYHEVMHTYVRRVSAVSALRKKYAAEDQTILGHLHVMALEKFVLLKLRKTEELRRVGSDYQTHMPPAYKRAWAIVNDIEGYESFVSELKQLAQPPR